MAQAAAAGKEDGCFLPDFCAIRTVLVVVVLAELLAFVLTLVTTSGFWRRFDVLALNSLLIQWIALACAAALCLARRRLARLPEPFDGAAAYGLVLAVILAVSELAWVITARFDEHGLLIASPHLEFLGRNLAVGALVAAVALRYCYLQHESRRRLAAQAEARLQALQARIRPHFFFNCMNTVASLTRTRPDAAERAIEDLADVFRVSFAEGRELVPLAEELELCRKYLAIESLRLGERLRVAWDTDGVPEGARLPALTLQPLVENAVYHGIEPRAGGGTVTVRARTENGRLLLDVENPLPAEGTPPTAGNRIAQDNVRERLAARFGDAATLEVCRGEDVYRVRVTVPLGAARR